MRKSAGLIPLLCLSLFTGCTLWGEHPIRHWADATGGEGLERNFWQEVKAGNWGELEHHIASNYVWMSPQGSLDKTGALDHLKQLKLNEYSLGEFRVELNTSTLVVTYTITMQASLDGQPVPNVPVRMMSVWQKQKAGWLAIAHTTIAPPEK